LEWCFSPRGDPLIGCNLVVVVVPLLLRLSFIGGMPGLSERAIALLPDPDKETKRELVLLESQAKLGYRN
jgi:hypothetical protein